MSGGPAVSGADDHGARTLIVYVSDLNSGRSQHALGNVRALLERWGWDADDYAVVDVLADPARAEHDGILVTPTVIRPANGARVVGDLSAADLAARALGLGSKDVT